jgi:hypothetical protein
VIVFWFGEFLLAGIRFTTTALDSTIKIALFSRSPDRPGSGMLDDKIASKYPSFGLER